MGIHPSIHPSIYLSMYYLSLSMGLSLSLSLSVPLSLSSYYSIAWFKSSILHFCSLFPLPANSWVRFHQVTCPGSSGSSTWVHDLTRQRYEKTRNKMGPLTSRLGDTVGAPCPAASSRSNPNQLESWLMI